MWFDKEKRLDMEDMIVGGKKSDHYVPMQMSPLASQEPSTMLVNNESQHSQQESASASDEVIDYKETSEDEESVEAFLNPTDV